MLPGTEPEGGGGGRGQQVPRPTGQRLMRGTCGRRASEGKALARPPHSSPFPVLFSPALAGRRPRTGGGAGAGAGAGCCLLSPTLRNPHGAAG